MNENKIAEILDDVNKSLQDVAIKVMSITAAQSGLGKNDIMMLDKETKESLTVSEVEDEIRKQSSRGLEAVRNFVSLVLFAPDPIINEPKPKTNIVDVDFSPKGDMMV